MLAVLGAVASEALDLTGFYYSGKPIIARKKSAQISRTSTGRYIIFFGEVKINYTLWYLCMNCVCGLYKIKIKNFHFCVDSYVTRLLFYNFSNILQERVE